MMESFLGEETFRTVLDDIDHNHKYEDIDFSTFERAAVGDTTESEDSPKIATPRQRLDFQYRNPGLYSYKSQSPENGRRLWNGGLSIDSAD